MSQRSKKGKPLSTRELQADAAAAPPRGRKRRGERERLVTWPFLLVTISTFAYFVSIGTLIPTLPLYVEGPLGGGSTSVGLAVGAFSVTAVLLRPWVGGLGDRRGRRLLIVAGSVFVGVSVAAYTLIDSLPWLIVLRLVTGMGEAFFYVGAASAVNDMAPEARRGEALSLFSLALYSGIAVGPVLGETVLGDLGFHWVWLVSALAGGVAMLFGLFVPETRVDVDEEQTAGRGSLIHKAGLKPGVILLTSVWGLAGFNALVPLYAKDIGMDGSRMVFVVYAVVVLLIRSVGARIPDRMGAGPTARLALGVSVVGLTAMAAFGTPAGLIGGAIVFALGQALALPALTSIAVRGASPSERGRVVGTFTAFFDAAFGLGAVSLGFVADAVGFRGAFLVAGGVAAVGLMLLIRFRREPMQAAEVGAAV